MSQERSKMISLKEKKYWIWLSLIPNLGSKKKQKLLNEYKNPEKIYYMKEKELLEVKGIGEKIVKDILSENIRECVQKNM